MPGCARSVESSLLQHIYQAVKHRCAWDSLSTAAVDSEVPETTVGFLHLCCSFSPGGHTRPPIRRTSVLTTDENTFPRTP